jgi:alginate lyase
MLRVLAILAIMAGPSSAPPPRLDVWAIDRERILKAADAALRQLPVTVTSASSPRSAGGIHDYFSEADYWWPDPASPGGPYIQRDGLSNPGNFDEHRKAMRRLGVDVPALVAAWKLTGEARYAEHAVRHLRAWFVDEATRMSPHLRYAQAIHGRVTGRGTGIIDTLHLVEVARAAEVLTAAPAFEAAAQNAVRAWFADYLRWMTTDKNGIEERDAKNNHATCWALQAAAFARLAGNDEVVSYCRDRLKTVLLPNQMAADGSFPEELRRTKPYGYSLFNLEAMAGLCQLLSTPQDNLWSFTLPDGRGMRRAMQFMVPYIRDKRSWPKPPDVMYDGEWPMRQASLLFAGLAFAEPGYLELWRKLPADSGVEEVVRNFFIRQPALWIGGADPTPDARAARAARISR